MIALLTIFSFARTTRLLGGSGKRFSTSSPGGTLSVGLGDRGNSVDDDDLFDNDNDADAQEVEDEDEDALFALEVSDEYRRQKELHDRMYRSLVDSDSTGVTSFNN